MASSTNATTSPLPPPASTESTDDPATSVGADASAQDGPRLLAFVVAGRLFGCPLADVREIIPSRATTRLPGAPPHVLGLLNLRGTLLTVLDLGLAALPALGARSAPALPAPAAAGGHVLVVEADGRRVGCRVDAVRRVYPMPALMPPTLVGNEAHHGIVLGIGDAGDTMVAVLDLPALTRQTLVFPGER